jgi:hypothetical protein
MNKLKVSSDMELLDINLQLFAGDREDGAIEPTTGTGGNVVDYHEDNNEEDPDYVDDMELDDSEVFHFNDDEELEGEKDQDIAEPGKREQSHEENAQFKKMRIKAEEQALKKLEQERKELAAERMRIDEEKREYDRIAQERRLQESITDDKVWQRADSEGITEQAARKILLLEAREEARHRAESIERQKNAFRSKKYFNRLEKDIDKLINENPQIDVNTAYKYLVGEKLDTLLETENSDIEKRTIANVQDRMKRRPTPTTSATGQSTVRLSKETLAINAAMGVDSREVAKHVKENKKRFTFR